ncbi:hypothetical protein J6590_018239 [Homalodisca vitripennis]|nr:hypothetical protein J6590_018239 [Homalodisca vitripennis]
MRGVQEENHGNQRGSIGHLYASRSSVRDLEPEDLHEREHKTKEVKVRAKDMLNIEGKEF